MSKRRNDRSRQAALPDKRARVRRKKRKRIRLELPPKMVYAFGITAALVVVVIMSFTLYFNVSQADIQGCELYTYDQVLAMSGVSGGTNLLRMNADVVEKRLVEGLPYVEEAKVTKKFPDSINIELKEATKGASLEDDGRYVIISKKAVALETNVKTAAAGCPVIKGFEMKADITPGKSIESKDNLKAKIVSSLMSLLDKYELEKVSEIDITDRTNIVLRYDDRLDIYIGSSYDMDYKLEEIKAVIDKGLNKNFKGLLRYNGTDSGISAIPEGAVATREKARAEKQAKRKKAEQTAKTDDDTGQTDEEPLQTDDTDDTAEVGEEPSEPAAVTEATTTTAPEETTTTTTTTTPPPVTTWEGW